MVNTEKIYRSPPNNYEKIDIFNLVNNFIDNPSTCSVEVIDLIKEKLEIKGRKITFLNKKTSILAGINPNYVDQLLNNKYSITIIVSPPITGELSNNPFWHRYDIFSNGNIKHILPFK